MWCRSGFCERLLTWMDTGGAVELPVSLELVGMFTNVEKSLTEHVNTQEKSYMNVFPGL